MLLIDLEMERDLREDEAYHCDNLQKAPKGEEDSEKHLVACAQRSASLLMRLRRGCTELEIAQR